MIRKCAGFFLALIFTFSFLTADAQADVLTDNLPEVLGSSYAVIDASSGDILFGKSYDSAVDPAGFSQIMTAILIIEEGNLSAEVTVPEIPTNANTGNKVYLREGEKIPMDKLLEAVIVYNANDAALAAAVHIAGDEESFVGKMNEKAEELGMSHTTFLSPYTAKEGQTSTAQDIAVMAAYAADLEEYAELASKESMSWNSDAWSRDDIDNSNSFYLYSDQALGIMLNNREEQVDLAASYENQGRKLVGVILEEDDVDIMYGEMLALFEYGVANTQMQAIVEKDKPMSTFMFANNKTVRLAAQETFSMVTPSNDQMNVSHNTVYNRIDLPIREGDELGVVKVYRDDELVREIPLVALDAAKKPVNWWTIIASILAFMYLTSIAYRLFDRSRSNRARRPKSAPAASSWTNRKPRLKNKSKANERERSSSDRSSSAQNSRKRKPTAEGKRQLEKRIEAKRQQRPPEERP